MLRRYSGCRFRANRIEVLSGFDTTERSTEIVSVFCNRFKIRIVVFINAWNTGHRNSPCERQQTAVGPSSCRQGTYRCKVIRRGEIVLKAVFHIVFEVSSQLDLPSESYWIRIMRSYRTSNKINVTNEITPKN